MRFSIAIIAALGLATFSTPAWAGIIADENAKAGSAGSWVSSDDGTAAADGIVDVYPGEWSIAAGSAVHLKIRSVNGYDLRVFRLGYYGGLGQREVKLVSGNPPSIQAYPVSDPTYGLAEAQWTNTITIAGSDTAMWTPGLYVARVEDTTTGKQAVTFFVVRDDTLSTKQKILFVIGTNTHEAYNAWPGASRGGKSLYGFNSSPTHPTADITGLTQAVKVSYDRPFLVGAGMGDVGGYEYPAIRWLEKNGWEVAYATDQDIHASSSMLSGRSVVIFSGHEEYTSRSMFDNAIAARDGGSNFLFMTGDTWSWQVRVETGALGGPTTLVGYKENYPNDPEQKAGYAAKTGGDIPSAKAHYRIVTRGWKNLEYDTGAGIDERRPGMILTGVQSAGVIRDAGGVPLSGADYPWADLIVTYPSFWLFSGTTLSGGSKIANIFGYEVDSCLTGSTEFNQWRPKTQTVLGTIKQVSDGKAKGSIGYYRADSGSAEIVALSAIYVSWGLDDWAWKSGASSTSANPVDANLQKMVTNALSRWTVGTPPPPPPPPPDGGIFDAGIESDADPVEKEGGTYTEAGPVDVGLIDAGFDATPPVDAPIDAPLDAVLDVPLDSTVPLDADLDALADADESSDATTDTGSPSDTGSLSETSAADAAGDSDAIPSNSGSACACSLPAKHEAPPGAIAGLLGFALAIASRRRRS